jgi:hypothetical protein
MGVLAVAALAGCSGGKPEAGSLQSTPISSQSAPTATMPSSPAATPKKSAAVHPSSSTTPSHKTSAGSAAGGSSSSPAGSSGSGSGSGSGSSASGSWVCETTALRAACATFHYPEIQGTYQDPNVSNDIWNPISGWQQKLYANSPGDWNVVTSGPNGNTAVVSYPSSDSPYPETPLSSFPALYSSFSENMHPQSGTSAEAAYDIWLNNWNNEVMIQHDIVNRGSCSTLATVDFGGSNGIPVKSWKLCTYGTEIIWQLNGGQEQSGSVDILAMLNWLVSHKYLTQKSTLTAIGYGFEICSTGGKPESFTVNGYSITT